ncbi:hypothetical protein NA56DRAFT_648943 [Hyaloscypha hepaticicola]|uniref:Uncharacterized protein n=1 Tax=Hyaloscypha hepaticicola TaxID=2082293 RepID=A0A2J6PSC9_9HELO|nr:hypothetical protein NA56DRAFT_648943 [Hyaloscypha hepaticicola]
MAVVVIAVKASMIDSTGRTLRVLDSTGEGVSVVNYVTDNFGGETAVDLHSRRFRGCSSCRYIAADFGGEAAINLHNCRF